MAKLTGDQIRELALKIIGDSPGGIHYGGLVKAIAADHPETPTNTIHGSVWDLATRCPEKVVKPSRGLFKPANADSGVEEKSAAPSKLKEDSFYEPFAEYLKNDLDEVTEVRRWAGPG